MKATMMGQGMMTSTKNAAATVGRTAAANKSSIVGVLIGGALIYYGFRKRSFLAGIARTIGTSIFGSNVAKVTGAVGRAAA